MKQFNVTGMSCAACSARVEKAVSAVKGVTSCSVSLLTNSMGVQGNASDASIIEAVEKAGYGASIKGNGDNASNNMDTGLKDIETPRLIKRLIASLIFLSVLMYFSMGHMMFEWPLPKWFDGNHVAMGIVQMLLATIIMVINQKFFVSGFKSLFKFAPNMDTLVALGASASYGYSVIALLAMTNAVLSGNQLRVMTYMDELYFESAGTILTLITVGKMLEARAKGKTTDALKSLMKLSPKNATLIKGNKEVQVPIEDVNINDIFVIRPGESVPVDGLVIEGESAIDESALTGESIPIDKAFGDKVSAATINKSGFLKCKATRVGDDTTLSQIIKMVSDAAATKAPIAKIADKVSGVFVPIVIIIAVLTFMVWRLAGQDISFSLSRGIAVLVISCPCALGLATPVAIMVGNGMGARNGILYKTAASLEEIAKIKTVILDKTGTITNGKPRVTDVIFADQKVLPVGENSGDINNRISEMDTSGLLKYAGSLEMKSEHPLALAVVDFVNENKIELADANEFKAMPGNGLCGQVTGKKVYGGNIKYISSIVKIDSSWNQIIDGLSDQAKTPLIFCDDKNILGVIGVADTIKEDSAQAVEQFKNMGIEVVMLTGDNEKTAKAIGDIVKVDKIIAGVLPDGKEAVVREFQNNGKVAMIGDGINDAPALVRADVGIAIGAGADVAIDAADIVLVKSRLTDATAAIRLGRKTLKNIKQNLFWAFIYNVIGIPLAAGVWYPLFGLKLNPMFGAAAMSLSSFCVVSNALRLNLLNIHDTRYDKNNNKKRNHDTINTNDEEINLSDNKKEIKAMEKKMNITGMMCGHCEARVKKVLEELPQVEEAIVSHENGTAVVKLASDISNEELTKTVTDQGYEVTSVE